MQRFTIVLACLVSVAARSPLSDTNKAVQAKELARLLFANQPGLQLGTKNVATRGPVMAAKRAAKKTVAPAKTEGGIFEGNPNSQRALSYALILLIGLSWFADKDGVVLDPSGFGFVAAGCGLPAGFAWFIYLKSKKEGSSTAYRGPKSEGSKKYGV
mmetsp:Transcript_75685/g.118300  ORF Transcript_75685/g.118300 Transcript_75685/m.118300 type:complete len:157 (+) Transcript_75685:90-560(+)